VDNQATLVRDGRPLLGQPGVDFAGLEEAETAVALLGPTSLLVIEGDPSGLAVARTPESASAAAAPSDASAARIAEIAGGPLPASATPERIAAIRARLAELDDRWRHLDDGGAITLAFPSLP